MVKGKKVLRREKVETYKSKFVDKVLRAGDGKTKASILNLKPEGGRGLSNIYIPMKGLGNMKGSKREAARSLQAGGISKAQIKKLGL